MLDKFLFHSMSKLIKYTLAVITVLVLLDQGVKTLVRTYVPLHRSSILIPNLIDLTHVENKGVSFSVLGGLPDGLRVPLLIGISLLALGILAYYWWHLRGKLNTLSHFAFQLILGGAIGNLIDRAVFGAVTDFLHFRFYTTSFFVNNIADIFISAGVVAYLLGMIRLKRRHQPS